MRNNGSKNKTALDIQSIMGNIFTHYISRRQSQGRRLSVALGGNRADMIGNTVGFTDIRLVDSGKMLSFIHTGLV